MNISVEDQIYICKYVSKIGITQVVKDLKKYTKEQVEKCIENLKKNGIYTQYKNMDEAEYECIVNSKPKVGRPRKQIQEETKINVEPVKSNESVEYMQGKLDAYKSVIKLLIERRD